MRMRAAHRIVVASIIGVVAASIQMTPAVARALPTPDSGRAPRARTPWLAPANLHPYRPAHHAQRHRREAPAVPDRTLLSDPLVLAWKHRSISRQEFVRYGLLNVVHRSKVPARFRTRQLTAGQSLAYYSYVMQQAKGLPAGQRAQLQSLSTPTLRRRTAASPQDVVSECAATASVFLYDFTCQHYTAHFAIFYNLKVVRDDGFIQSQGLPDADADGNGLPDALDELAEAFEKSYDVYTSMGYKIDQDNGRNLVLVGVDDGGQGTGAAITLPTGLLATGGAPFVMLPSDPGATNYSYLPRHELFHAFQYHYLNLDHLLLNLASLNPDPPTYVCLIDPECFDLVLGGGRG